MTNYELAEWYGNDMKRYGMSHYNDRIYSSDPTPKLYSMKEFDALTKEEKDKLLEYGNNMLKFGMGMYADHGSCAEYYNRCGGQPPKNPFDREKANEGYEF